MGFKTAPINTKTVQKAAKSEWPENVPVLSPANMVKGSYSSMDGKRHCLYQQVCNVFFDPNAKAFVCHLMVDEIKRTAPKLLDSGENADLAKGNKDSDSFIIGFNDHENKKVNSKVTSAVFNRTMARLGYTQGNPEAKNVKGRIISALA